jgi:putative hemolysin
MTVVSWLGVFGVTGLVATLQGLANLFPRRLSPARAAEHGVTGTDGWMVLYFVREALHLPVARQRFDRFAPAMRAVLRHTQQEALERGHAYVTPDHLLLSLLRDEDGVAVAELALIVGDTGVCHTPLRTLPALWPTMKRP